MLKPGELPGAWERCPAVARGPGRWTSSPSGPGFLGCCRPLGEAERGEPEAEGLSPKASGSQDQRSGDQKDEGTWPITCVAPREHLHEDTQTQKARVQQKDERPNHKLPRSERSSRKEALGRRKDTDTSKRENARQAATRPPCALAPLRPSRRAVGSGPGPQLRGSPHRWGVVGVTSRDSRAWPFRGRAASLTPPGPPSEEVGLACRKTGPRRRQPHECPRRDQQHPVLSPRAAGAQHCRPATRRWLRSYISRWFVRK